MDTDDVDRLIVKDLIQINNDRLEGYLRAINELQPMDEDLKTIFAGMSKQSAKYKSILMEELEILSGDSENQATARGKIYNAWKDINIAFGGHDRQTVLNNCKIGEDATMKAYETALDTKGLSLTTKSILESQQMELQAASNHINTLKGSIA
jgi:uncharacterized protein (TIGR02284 family)